MSVQRSSQPDQPTSEAATFSAIDDLVQELDGGGLTVATGLAPLFRGWDVIEPDPVGAAVEPLRPGRFE